MAKLRKNETKSFLEKSFLEKRSVLFEKHHTYYYPRRASLCILDCKVFNDGTRIGSGACHDCVFNVGLNYDEGYLICKRLTKAING
jgi:hypothetical protein